MAEKNNIMTNEIVSFKGLFHIDDLFSMTNDYFKELGYDINIGSNQTDIESNHKKIKVVYNIWKKISDYIKYVVKVEISSKMNDVEILIDGVPSIVQKGDITISISGTVISDYEKSWEQKPEYFFIRTLFNKYIYKVKNSQDGGTLSGHVGKFKAEVASFLNMGRFEEHNTTHDIIK